MNVNDRQGVIHILTCTLSLIILSLFMYVWAALVITFVAVIAWQMFGKLINNPKINAKDLVYDLVGMGIGLIIALSWLIIHTM